MIESSWYPSMVNISSSHEGYNVKRFYGDGEVEMKCDLSGECAIFKTYDDAKLCADLLNLKIKQGGTEK